MSLSTLHVNNWQNWLHHLMETSSKAVESSWDRQITSIYRYLTPKIQDLKNRSKNMYRCAGGKISKTENKVTVADCDVENLDHQNWQLLEDKSYIFYFNNQAKNLAKKKNGTASGFGRKIGRDGGIEKKKRRERGIWEPLLWTLLNLVSASWFWRISQEIEATRKRRNVLKE